MPRPSEGSKSAETGNSDMQPPVVMPLACRFLYASDRNVMQKLHKMASSHDRPSYLDNDANRRYPLGLPSFERG